MERNRLGKEKVGDKLGKNKPGRVERKATNPTTPNKGGMKGTMKRQKVYRTRGA